jgi:trimethylamine--corrinoid protein Co-methyltransferase
MRLLDDSLVDRILAEAFSILETTGVKVQSAEGLALLEQAGAAVDRDAEVARIPETLAHDTLASVPREFHLHDRDGRPAVRYGGDDVHFDPGSAAVHVLDPETRAHRPGTTADFVRLLKVAEVLPEYDAQSTALVCSDVPPEIADLWRLHLLLNLSTKPIVTGAFGTATLETMIEMVRIAGVEGGAGGAATGTRSRAVFDVCPSPPLIWSAFGTHSLIHLARAGVPAQIVSMPLAGATAPATLAGSVVQHAAECLSGITLHQLARKGAPIVWGGAPAIFDMRHGTTPMGAMETAMIDAAYAQVGKHLGLPTHAYLGASDAKTIDAQAGLESGLTALVGALAGINMISGAGMLDFLACQSVEKLVVDAEGIGMVRRLLAGIEPRGDSLAAELLAITGHHGNFLELKHTRQNFKLEQRLPSAVIDRGSVRAWAEAGSPDAAARARVRVRELLATWRPRPLPPAVGKDLGMVVESAACKAGMSTLPSMA